MEARASSVLTLVATLVVTMGWSCYAYDFYVGGRQGWVQNPSESYNQWAERNRFQVNDRLVFRYKNGEDSVLQVTEPDYRACKTSNPIRRLDGGGGSVFQFDRSGPFYFISGVPARCQAGEKLVVVVLAARGVPRPGAPPPTAGAPSPLTPPSKAPSPSPPSAGPSPAPTSGAPAPALPAPSPTAGGGPVSAAPASEAPLAPGQSPGGSSDTDRRVPFGAAAAAIAVAGATFLFI